MAMAGAGENNADQYMKAVARVRHEGINPTFQLNYNDNYDK